MNGVSPDLTAAYATCRSINRRHGSSFFWATMLLPRSSRPHVHALYAFARTADDLVDHPTAPDRAAAELDAFGQRFVADLAAGTSHDPVLTAVLHTIERFDLPLDAFERFLRSMRADTTTTTYAEWSDLLGYMDGSAAAIGEMMLPILGPSDRERALEPARQLGRAFQLTNFLRDIAEDLDRGRQYVPQADLRRFGVELTERQVTPEFEALMRFEIERCRVLYRDADAGIALLSGRSARCIHAARRLYSGILDRIEAHGYDVFAERIALPTSVKVGVAARELALRS